jgi:hypothetical protein
VQLAGVPVPTTCAEAQVGAATDAHTTRAVRRIFVLMGPGSTRCPGARRRGRPTWTFDPAAERPASANVLRSGGPETSSEERCRLQRRGIQDLIAPAPTLSCDVAGLPVLARFSASCAFRQADKLP